MVKKKSIKRILVFGGAGYIGSHVVKALVEKKYSVAIYDNFSTGRKEHVKKKSLIYKANILNTSALKKSFEEFKPDAVIHLAAEKSVGKSMSDANSFSDVNIIGTINILKAMHKYNVKNIVFSSSAAVFGIPHYLPVDEEHVTQPINYYGATKKIIEEILYWYDKVYNITFSSLRYFNAAGHAPDCNDILVIEKEPQNLIPVILETALKKRALFEIFGKKFKTSDGTCIRDYIHVCDLADAHIKSLEYINNENKSLTLNLGTGCGFSVKTVYDVACKITGINIPMKVSSPRPGDPDILYAKSIKAQKILGWKPQYKNLEDIISHAWNAYKKYYIPNSM